MIVSKGLVSLSKWVSLPILERFSRLSLFIPYYHMVANGEVPHVKYLFPFKNERQFRGDLDYLASRYHPLSLPGLIDHVKHGTPVPSGSFLLTFDDGYSEMYSVVAPILEEKGLPAVFFVNTDSLDNRVLGFKNKASLIADALVKGVEVPWDRLRQMPGFHGIAEDELFPHVLSLRYQDQGRLDELAGLLGIQFEEYLARRKPYLSSDQIRGLIGRGFAIGSHSIDHPLYGEIDLEEQVRQTLESIRFLKKRFRLSYAVFAFPHSDHGVRREFFGRIKSEVDVTFGTSNIFVDPVASNLQRLNFEKSQKPAREILVRYTAKKLVYQLLRKDTLERA